jgi:signal transduction histidine kinase
MVEDVRTLAPEAAERNDGGAENRSRPRSMLGPLLQVPLFFKLFLANGTIVAGVTVVGAMMSIRFGGEWAPGDAWPSFLLLATAGIVASLAANAAIVWIALTPVRSLETTAARIRAGDHAARAESSVLADRDLERLARTFNEVLDAVADQTRRLREMAARAQSATEEERRRLARELHDGIAQSLAALNIRVKLARRAADSQIRASDLDEVSGGIADAILELRRMARGLRPPALEMLGLAAAVESHARSVTESAGIEARIATESIAGLLSPDAELAVYRIMQESLSNVIRHSGAGAVTLTLAPVDSKVQLLIEDDGKGFDPAGMMTGDRGLGIFGMRERAAFIGGDIEITSQRGRGTRVVLSVPVPENTTHGG